MKCFCGRDAILVDSGIIYRRSYGKMWICSGFPGLCDGRVGCHGGTTEPYGTLADAEVRKLRRRCHEEFDRLWLTGGRYGRKRRRTAAYRWLADMFGRSEVHIGNLQKESCEKVLSLMDDLKLAGVRA